ncbi:hypothetical protein CKO_01914 [Citrobacter koseri ATCC BAA-895]|uniref:Uncharacterized protein n=1 Tax=Citrobacter koseri (strain ATCC BAA-895 / CDC 4225-83 / SGSC4696) TaxID=290338 RepID=A8AHS7_CITK8|nr:hypothetical protein CKO_01914 [Citrobacter koseri ATCC BAA-895]
MANFLFHISGLLVNFRAPSDRIQRIALSSILFLCWQAGCHCDRKGCSLLLCLLQRVCGSNRILSALPLLRCLLAALRCE